MASPKFPGWRVVTGCFLVLLVNCGLGFYGLAVYLNAFSKERGWAVASISLATTLYFVVSGITGVYVARLISKYDVRWIITVGALLGGASLATFGLISEQWQLYLGYSVFALGFSAAGLVPVTTVVTRWFVRRRSVALSVASTGLSVGGIVLTPAAKWLIDAHGLAASAPWLGLVYAAGIVPITWLLIVPQPADVGWLPDGERPVPSDIGAIEADAAAPPRLLAATTATDESTAGVSAGDSPPGPAAAPLAAVVAQPAPTADEDTSLADALRSRFFVLLTIGYILALGSQVGAIQQLVKLAEERTTANTAAVVTLVLASVSVIARLIGGWLAEVMPMGRLTVIIAVLQGFSLIGIAYARSVPSLMFVIAVFGATIGNLLMLQPLLLATRFGVREYANIYSRAQLFVIVGNAGGPYLLGRLHDASGNYTTAYVVAGFLSIAGAMFIAAAGPATELRASHHGPLRADASSS